MTATTRPAYITFLSVIGVLQGFIGLLLGIFVILDHDDVDLLARINDNEAVGTHQVTSSLLLSMGISVTVIAVSTILVAFGLSRGSNLARWIFAIVLVANAASGLYALVALHGEQQFSAAFTLSFSLFTLWYLFGNDRTDEFFEHGPAAR